VFDHSANESVRSASCRTDKTLMQPLRDGAAVPILVDRIRSTARSMRSLLATEISNCENKIRTLHNVLCHIPRNQLNVTSIHDSDYYVSLFLHIMQTIIFQTDKSHYSSKDFSTTQDLLISQIGEASEKECLVKMA